MFGDKFSLGGIMKNAKKMQEMMEQTQAELTKLIITGEAGAGAVKVTMNGRYAVSQVHIDEEIRNSDVTVLQDLVAAAINDAVSKVEEVTRSRVMDFGKMFGGGEDKE